MAKSVSKNSVFSMLNKGLSVVFPLVTVSYVSRVLGANGIGEVSSAQNIATYFSMAAALGIPSYGVRAIAQSKSDKNKCNKVFSELFVINFIASIISTILYFIAVFFLQNNYSNFALTVVFSAIIIFNIINIEWVYQGFEEYKYIMIRSFLIKMVSLLLLVICVRQKTDLVQYSIVICFGSIGNYVLNSINLCKYVRFDFQNMELKKHIAPIMTFFVAVIAIEIYSLLDVSMLSAMSNAASVGYYSNSTKIVKAVANTLTGISAVLMPRFSYLFGKHNYNEIQRLSSQFLNITFLISIPCCFGIILEADRIVNILFGADFIPAITTIKLLALLIILMPLSGGVFCQLLLTSGNEKKYLLCVFCGTIVNASLNYILIPAYIQNGAAIASVIAEFSVSLCMIVVSRKTIQVSMRIRDLFSIVFSTIVMTLLLISIRNFSFTTSTLFNLIFEISFSVIIYSIFIVLCKNSISNKILLILKRKSSTK